MTYYIVGGGEFDAERFLPRQGDCILAADAGYAVLERRGIFPNAVIGDFDSLETIPNHPRILRFPIEKDDTDMALCVRLAEEEGADRILIYGGTGGRMDHTLANFALLADLSSRGITAFLLGKDYTATAVTNGKMLFPEEYRGTVSVFCWGKTAEGVCEEGLYYSLNHASLNPNVTLGTSNSFTGTQATVSVDDGTLLILWEDRNVQKLPIFCHKKSE